MSASDPNHSEVLIVGAGPVGLALSIELGRRGIRTRIIEQHDRTGYQPRAKTTNVRTMEHMRRWGLADTIRTASPLPRDYPRRVVFATRLCGYQLAEFHNVQYGAQERNELFSEPAEWIPQYTVEAVLRDHVQTLPSVTLSFNMRLETAEQTAAGVTAEVTDLTTGETRTLTATYVVGADGARSRVRQIIGVRMEGTHAYAQNLTAIIRAPGLAALHDQGRAIMYWLVNGDSPGIVAPLDHSQSTWTYGQLLPPGVTELSEEEMRRRVIQGVGREFDFEILTMDPWATHRLVATRYREGRILLAGDACHLHPPMGGYGMNMGIGDGVDLGWKLSAVLRGWGGAALLDSYEQERRPVHDRVIREAVENYAVLGNNLMRENLEKPGPEGDHARQVVGEEIQRVKVREFKALGVVLGYHYSGSPITVADGSAPPEEDFLTYRPSAHPGCIAPHAWLADGSSLYDHFGDGFTLLSTEAGGAAEAAAFTEAFRQAHVPLTSIAPDDPRLRDLYQARFALIRPDQHVAWRGDAIPDDPAAVIAQICGGRPTG